MKKEDEVILVVKRGILFSNERTKFQGPLFDTKEVDRKNKLIANNYKTMRRGSVEENSDPSQNAEKNYDYKQPIPYIVIKKGDQFYVTERLEGGGETRLHGKLSMGVGGHMNPIEGFNSFPALLMENTLRELNEELFIEDNGEEIEIEMNGLINDDENEVGKVHIGLLGQISLSENQDVSIRETEQLKGSWYTLSELLEDETYDRLEAWGQIVVDSLAFDERKEKVRQHLTNPSNSI